jgi:DNA mismatch endonuclease (patch repair protein)
MSGITDPERRSETMSSIRSKNTKAEIVVFKYLNKEVGYYKKHYANIFGKPDIALPRKKKAVFIDGDFWHGRDSNKFKKLPKEYWQPKIRRNIERDKVNAKLLKESGWTFIRIWESDINRKSTREETLKKIKAFLLA